MGQRKQTERAKKMHELYERGYSLEQVGLVFGVTRQSVYGMFKSHGYQTRRKQYLPKITRGDFSYTLDPDGYFRRTDGDRRYLHHCVWIEMNGPIPNGMVIHHKDGNKANNVPDNLIALTPSGHSMVHHPLGQIPEKHCLFCGALLIRKARPSGVLETPAEIKQRLYCGTRCRADHSRGKPRGWSPKHKESF